MSAHDPFAATIAHHSKSFALASRLLPPGVRQQALVLYAYCRRADDAVDLCSVDEQPAALQRLRDELDAIYRDRPGDDPITQAFARVVHAYGIAREIPQDLLAGMEMDVLGTRYQSWAELERYCHCVAGTVGLMMCQVMGVTDPRAPRHAADLGIAMQLTNICRDVLEDWQRGRLYLPGEALQARGAGSLVQALGGPLPAEHATALRATIGDVLERAAVHYASGDAGLPYLSPRCRLSIRTARLVYAAIGDAVRARGCDPLAGRAVVPHRRKLMLAAHAAIETALETLRATPRGRTWPDPSS